MMDGGHIVNREVTVSQQKKSSDFKFKFGTQRHIWNSMTDSQMMTK